MGFLVFAAGIAAVVFWPRIAAAAAAATGASSAESATAAAGAIAPDLTAGIKGVQGGGGSAAAGAASGAAAGASVGSAVPVIGTAIGGVIGAIAGALVRLGLNDSKRTTAALENANNAYNVGMDFLRRLEAAGVAHEEAYYIAHLWTWDLMNRGRAGRAPYTAAVFMNHTLMLQVRDAGERMAGTLRTLGRGLPAVPGILPGDPPSRAAEPAAAPAALPAMSSAELAATRPTALSAPAPSIQPSTANLSPLPASGGLLKVPTTYAPAIAPRQVVLTANPGTRYTAL